MAASITNHIDRDWSRNTSGAIDARHQSPIVVETVATILNELYSNSPIRISANHAQDGYVIQRRHSKTHIFTEAMARQCQKSVECATTPEKRDQPNNYTPQFENPYESFAEQILAENLEASKHRNARDE